MALSVQDYTALRRIHSKAISAFKYVSDKTKWGLVEYWEPEDVLFPVGARFTGDCEEFARVCMQESIKAGYKARLVACLTEGGEGHCICEVADEEETGSFFLDNRKTNIVTKLGLTGYKFYSVSPWNPQFSETRPWRLVKE